MIKNPQREKQIAAAVVGTLLVIVLVAWRVSRSHAKDRAADLVTASADLIRCVAGDPAVFDRAAVRHAFRRRLVISLPDLSPVGDCPQALELVHASVASHAAVWFGSASSKGKDDQPLASKIKASVDAIGALPFTTPSNKMLRKKDEGNPLHKFPDLAVDLLEAASDLMVKEGASTSDVNAAREIRKRTARKIEAMAPTAKPITSVTGRVLPERWSLTPSGNQVIDLFAHSDRGQAMVARSDNAGAKWHSSIGSDSLPGKQDSAVVQVPGPGGSAWLVASYSDADSKSHVLVGKVPPGTKSVPALVEIPGPPGDWARVRGADREVVPLADDLLAYPVRRIADKPDKQKRAEAKQRKEWEKKLDDKEVQAAIILDNARADTHKALGIGEDHVAIDGIAYVRPGQQGVLVKELAGYGLGGLIAGAEPLMLLGQGEIPTTELLLTTVPPVDQPLGQMASAKLGKPLRPALRASAWFRCLGSDGTHFAMTEHGAQLLGMRNGILEIVPMTAEAADTSHMGCGEATAVMALPFKVDTIFTHVLTVRGGEIEGAKVATTSGTKVDEYNATVAVGVVGGGIIVGWVAEGYVLYAASKNWGTEFGAPRVLAEATVDGSRISGLRIVGVGNRLTAVLAREACPPQGACTTTFETLVSDDAGVNWQSPS